MSSIEFMGADGFVAPITNIGMYSDATTFVKTDDFNEIVERADTVMLRPQTLPELLAGLSVVDGVRYHGGKINRLILPYIPGARQDRSNPKGDVAFMLNTIGRLINSYNFETVLVADPHSRVAGDVIKNMVEYPLIKMYEKLPGEYYRVIAPDKGATRRATNASVFCKTESLAVVFADKTRSVVDGSLTGFNVEVEAGKHYIVVDDICDGGGTFVGLGEKIREQNATADLFVTHGIFSKGTSELRKHYKTIYTTNTRDISDRNRVEVIDILSEMRNYNV